MKTPVGTMMILVLGLGPTAFGSDTPKTAKNGKLVQMTAEQRKNMATAHDKMAECLRSDKSLQSCQNEMMQSCQDMMGKDGCAMMGQMGNMQGKMGRGMMQGHDMLEDSSSKSGATSPDDSKHRGE